MGSVSLSQSVNSRGVTATISWNSSFKVTVTVTGNAGYGAQAGWRIRGKNPDTTIYCQGDQNTTTGSFQATEGKSYYFQAVWGSVSNGAAFTVEADDEDDGGDSGGSSGGGDTTTYDLGIKQVEGVTVKVYKSVSGKFKDMTSSLSQSYQGGVLWYTLKISWGDVFKFEFNVENGYTLESKGINGLTYYSSDNTYEFYGSSNPYIIPVVTKNPVSEVPNLPGISTTGKVYAFIDNGSEWIPINT